MTGERKGGVEGKRMEGNFNAGLFCSFGCVEVKVEKGKGELKKKFTNIFINKKLNFLLMLIKGMILLETTT